MADETQFPTLDSPGSPAPPPPEAPLPQEIGGSRRFLGPEHPDVAAVLLGEAEVLQRMGRLDEAEQAARRGPTIRLAKIDEASPLIAAGRLRLGQILSARKEYREADELLRLAAESYRTSKGISDANTQKAIRARIDLYRSWRKTGEARAQEALLAENAAKREKR